MNYVVNLNGRNFHMSCTNVQQWTCVIWDNHYKLMLYRLPFTLNMSQCIMPTQKLFDYNMYYMWLWFHVQECPPWLCSDNQGSFKLVINPKFHKCTKHFDQIAYHSRVLKRMNHIYYLCFYSWSNCRYLHQRHCNR